MLSLKLIGIFALLFTCVTYVMAVTQLERRSLRKGAEKPVGRRAGAAQVNVEERNRDNVNSVTGCVRC